MGLVPVKPNNAPVVEGDDNMICVDRNETVRMFEAEGPSQMGFAGITQAILSSRALSEMVGSQGYGVEVVGMVKDEDAESVVLCGISEGDTGGSYGIRKAKV